jgi:ribosome biogenesis GTPase / thiamine phosphate phosphatase
LKEGLVTKVAGSLYTVMDNSGSIFHCRVEGKLRKNDLKSTNPIVVGDKVFFEYHDAYEIGTINEVKKRKNYIIRKSTNLSKQYHIIAANVDQALLLVTLKEPATNTEFIDRFLVTAEAYNIPVILIFNKIDLYNEAEMQEMYNLKKIYTDIGYKCVEVSALRKINIEVIMNLIKEKVNVFNGNSGVGKSLLIKSIDSNINIKVGEISSYHRSGTHTTTFNEMFKINSGGFVIDTPGIKGFGLIDFYKEELYHYFPEIFNLSKSCKFYNCTHIHEPGCEVVNAFNEGRIAKSRYISYKSIFFDKEEKYRK